MNKNIFRSLSLLFVQLTVVSAGSSAAQIQPNDPAPIEIRTVVRVDSPLVRSQDQTLIPKHLRESVTAITIEESKWKALSAHRDVLIESVPFGPSQTHSLIVHRADPFENHPRIVGATIAANGVVIETPIAIPAIDCYVGSLLNDPKSRVLLSRGDGFLVGYVQANGKTWILSNERAGGNGPIVSYGMDDVPPGTFDIPNWTCEALQPPDSIAGAGSEGGIADSMQPCWQSRIAIDTDVEFLALFANNQAAAIGYVGTLFAALSDIYPRDTNLRPGMASLRLWTNGTDPWNATNTSTQLTEFRSFWEAQPETSPHESAALLSGRGLGGGVAWLNSGCGSYAYSVSANLAGSFPYPLLDNNSSNWDIMVVAHELGHNYGAPHTHNYTPPADGCGSSPQDCSAATNDLGTIMSYCHTCPGGMANMNLYFHALNVGSIQAYLQSAACPFSAAAQPAMAVPERMSAVPGTTIDIDVMGNDVKFNCETISLLGITQPGQGCSAMIVVGAGPSGRNIVRFTSPNLAATTVTFNYTIAELSGTQATATVTIDLTPMRLPENPTGDTPGITTQYYILSAPTVLPNFIALTPYSTTSVAQMNFDSTSGNFATSNRANEVGAVFTGWLNVPTAGTWTLYTNSDDGSRLLIGTTQVVTNDGLHGMVEKSGTVDLAPGKHAVRVEFFENGGGAGLLVSWSGPNTSKALIPASALSKGGTINRADINRDGSVGGPDLTALLSAWGTNDANADINQDGTVNGSDMTNLLSAWSN